MQAELLDILRYLPIVLKEFTLSLTDKDDEDEPEGSGGDEGGDIPGWEAFVLRYVPDLS